LPFRGEVEPAIVYSVLNEDPEPVTDTRRDVPVAVEDIIEKALVKDPSNRYQTIDEMLSALETQRDQIALGIKERRFTLLRRLRRRKRLVAVIAATVVIVAAVTVWRSGLIGFGAEPTFASVAVIPFEYVGPEEDIPAWLLYGFGEQLVTQLAELGTFRVTSWSSSQYVNVTRDKSPRDVARTLKVDALITGSLRVSNDRIWVSIALVDGDTEFQHWTDEFDEARDDVFAVQKRIALGVASGLMGQLSGEDEAILAQPPAGSPKAYRYYLQGTDAIHTETPEANSTALAYFEKALALDPELTDALVGVGAVHVNRYFYGWEGGFRNLELADESFRRALAIDSQYGPAKRGLVRVAWQLGHSEAVLAVCQDIEITENSGVPDLYAKAESYLMGGLPERSLPLLRRIMKTEPTNEGALWMLVAAEAWSNEHQSCIDNGETYFSRFGEHPEVHTWVAVSHQALGHFDAAAIHFRRALRLFGEHTNFYTAIYAGPLFEQLGMEPLAMREYRKAIDLLEPTLEAYPDNHRMRGYLAMFYALVGDTTRFLEASTRIRQGIAEGRVPDDYVLLATAHARLGFVDEAVRVFCNASDEGVNEWFETKQYMLLAGMAWLIEDDRVKPCLVRLRRLYEDLDRRY